MCSRTIRSRPSPLPHTRAVFDDRSASWTAVMQRRWEYHAGRCDTGRLSLMCATGSSPHFQSSDYPADPVSSPWRCSIPSEACSKNARPSTAYAGSCMTCAASSANSRRAKGIRRSARTTHGWRSTRTGWRRSATGWTYFRPGEYRANIYSMSLITIDLGDIADPGAKLLHLWRP